MAITRLPSQQLTMMELECLAYRITVRLQSKDLWSEAFHIGKPPSLRMRCTKGLFSATVTTLHMGTHCCRSVRKRVTTDQLLYHSFGVYAVGPRTILVCSAMPAITFHSYVHLSVGITYAGRGFVFGPRAATMKLQLVSRYHMPKLSLMWRRSRSVQPLGSMPNPESGRGGGGGRGPP